MVRTRLQEQGHSKVPPRYTGVLDCIKKIWLEEGIAGFYRGCGTNLLRTTPAAVITFTSFELFLRQLNSLFPSHNALGVQSKEESSGPHQGACHAETGGSHESEHIDQAVGSQQGTTKVPYVQIDLHQTRTP